MARVEIAYSLIVLMLAALGGGIAYLSYHSRERTYRRRLRRERAEYAQRVARHERNSVRL